MSHEDDDTSIHGLERDREAEIARSHTDALDHLESAVRLYRNHRYRDGLLLLRRALAQELESLPGLGGEEEEVAGERLPRNVEDRDEFGAVLSEMTRLRRVVDELEERMARDPTESANVRAVRGIFRESSGIFRRADAIVGAKARSERRAELRRLAWRALLVTVGALAFALVGSYLIRAWKTSGNGLQGEYFAGTDFDASVAARVDETIAFDWQREDPPGGLEPHHFSVRWKGEIEVHEAGEYAFEVRSDDGARLWIDEQLVIDAWLEQSPRAHGGTIVLSDGWHDIRLEYFQNVGGAVCELHWRPPGRESPEVVPATSLRPR